MSPAYRDLVSDHGHSNSKPSHLSPPRRRSDNPPPFQITPRDVDILRAVTRHRFLHSDHICRLVGGSPKNIRNRLKGLFEHAYLDRPECQYDFYRPGGGSSLAVYALADKGARLLIREDGITQGTKVSWSQKNRALGRPFLEHTLAIADFAVGLHTGVRERSDIELVDGDNLVARMPEGTRTLSKPLRFSVPVIFKATRQLIGVEADYAFSLGFPAIKRRANYLVEIDRSTMPVARSDLSASSILRKFLAYQELWRAKLHTNQFGWHNFRVLIITSDADRVENMRDCLRRQTDAQGSPLFWFANKNTLVSGDLLNHSWVDGAGKTQKLNGCGH